MKKIDGVGTVLNVALGILYVPLSLFSWLMMMVSESTIGATNPLYIAFINVFCVIAFLVPLLCVAGTVASVILRTKGRSILSIIAQCAPLAVFLLNILLLVITDMIPSVI